MRNLSEGYPGTEPTSASGGFVEMDGEEFYLIENVDSMPPFLVNLVSANDHWMFIASNGALTAGRRDADNALFPYCTQDKLFDSASVTGSLSLVWVDDASEEAPFLWEPFSTRAARPDAARRLYKNSLGSKIVFEEVLEKWGLVFRYQWSFGAKFGFVRTVSLENRGGRTLGLRVLDGIQNLLPYGLDQAFVNQFSNLADAYKKCELLAEEGLGIYYLSSIPTDKSEPSEGLKATTVWSADADFETLLLTSDQVERFRRGSSLRSEVDERGRRCAYLAERRFELAASSRRSWRMIADVNQDACQVEALCACIASGEAGAAAVDADVSENSIQLRRKIAAADGLQCSADRMRDVRHQSNALFNIMRGGVFNDGYAISVADFLRFLRAANVVVWEQFSDSFSKQGAAMNREDLIQLADRTGDADLARLAREYLPLTFSRRHGDPSRPWNRFSIKTEDGEGNPILSYEGNWRDIFQNWEPLAHSFPKYFEGMILRFLNASTADGYNPYRLMRNGFDWEKIEPDEPWSNIGYWGDHQIVYLLKLLEGYQRFYPGALRAQLGEARFVYAHVPYRIRGFDQILANPRVTVDYDEAAASRLERLEEAIGADGKLLRDEDGAIVRATLLEKLFVPLLSKIANLVPDAGIWMNTQRPEWNDANNALVGYGVSVVTLCYCYRYVGFLQDLLDGDERDYDLNTLIFEQIDEQARALGSYESTSGSGLSDAERFQVMEILGRAAERFRSKIYEQGPGEERRLVSADWLRGYLASLHRILGASIDSNRRSDGLYHSYNLLDFDLREKEAKVERLSVMLEGQVAALSSGRLSRESVSTLLEQLPQSPLYREDINSYLLYPDRKLPTFLEKNVVPEQDVESLEYVSRMLELRDWRVLQRDVKGQYRFNGSFRNSEDLRILLKRIQKEERYSIGEAEIAKSVELFERVFDHRRFLGRSGTFFAYEGLGSVYWHMVSKLVLAVQENCLKYDERSLRDAFRAIISGLGLESSPASYGAFPVDAYSHTPRHAGAQQPGMTGQVKEDLLTRWAELGLNVTNGRIQLDPRLLKRSDLLIASRNFHYIDAGGTERTIRLEPGQLAFTFCQTLFVMVEGDRSSTRVCREDGEAERDGLTLTQEESESVFSRSGSMRKVEFTLPRLAS